MIPVYERVKMNMVTELLLIALMSALTYPFARYGLTMFKAIEEDRRILGYTLAKAKRTAGLFVFAMMLAFSILRFGEPSMVFQWFLWYDIIGGSIVMLSMFITFYLTDINLLHEHERIDTTIEV